MKQFIIFAILCGTAFGQGYSVINFSQGTTGSAPTQTNVFNSWYGSLGSGSDTAFGCTIGTATCDVKINNSASAMTIVAQSSSVCGTPPASVGVNGKLLDYSTTAGNGNANQDVLFNFPAAQSTVQEGVVWWCSNIPLTASFGTTFDGVILISSVSRISNFTSNGSAQAWDIEGASVGTINVTSDVGVWYQVSFQHANSGRCLDTTNYTDCDRLAISDVNGNLIGEIAACDTVTGGTTGCAAATTIGDYVTLGNLNSATLPTGYHVQFANLKLCTQGCTPSQFPMLETPVPTWDGIVTPQRGINWTLSGIPGNNNGTLPSVNWTQCGSTLAAGTYAGSTITTTLSGCAASTYYLLGAGTFNLTGQISIPTNVELRGSGAGNTFLVWTGSLSTCNQIAGAICMKSPTDGSYTTQPPPNTCTVSATGLTQGSTSITLTNSTGTCQTGITANSTMLVLDWCDTGYSGTGNPGCGTGNATDNSNWFVCGLTWNVTVGCSQDGPDGGGSRNQRDQLEFHTCTAYNSTTGVCTLAQPIMNANAAVLSNPQVWILQPGINQGLTNLSVNLNSSGGGECWEGFNIFQWWVSGVACIDANNRAFNCLQCANGIIQSSYIYNVKGTPPSQYGIRLSASGNNLIQNNILQQVLSPYFHDGANTGNVIAYNYVVNDVDPSNTMSPAFDDHAGNYYNLYEGNIGNGFSCDDIHGTCDQETLYRNAFWGWESFPTNQQNTFTNAIADWAFARYTNNIGNILGTPGYHTGYSAPKTNADVYWMGGGGSNGNGTIPNDTLTPCGTGTSICWASYDSVTATNRFCGNALDTGWSTTCGSAAETAFGASTYPGFIPVYGDTAIGEAAMPASLFYPARPGFFKPADAWPLIGPDVSGGTIFQCNGTINTSGRYNGTASISASSQCGKSGTGWNGEVNASPAMRCAQVIMGIPPDGSGSAGSFTCDYPLSGAVVSNATINNSATVSNGSLIQ